MSKLDRVIRQFNKQRDKLLPAGYVLHGSVVKRYLQRPRRGVSTTYGPYYLWTRKIENKTVTCALTAAQAKIIQEAIQRNRQLEQCVTQLQALSEQILFAITPCVAKRKRSS
jgi:hypothetical protein